MAGMAARAGARGGGNGRVLLAALAFGLLTAALIVIYLRDAQRREAERAASSIPVVVARREVPLGASITSAMVELKYVPPDVAVAGAFSEPARVIGLRARYPISEGAQVVPGMVVQSGSADALSYIIPPGKRAVSVNAGDATATGGHIRPGDFVDVLVTIEAWKLIGGTPTSNSNDRPKGIYTVLQNVEVLAVRDDAQKIAESGPNHRHSTNAVPQINENRTVTLGVDPAQAQLLFWAESQGRIRLSLRPFGERAEQHVPPFIEPLIITTGQATPAATATPRPAATPAR